MANVLAPFGFKHIGYLDGVAPNFAPSVRAIDPTNNTKIYRGDPVTSQTSGYIAQSSPTTTQIAGIFDGCSYLSVSQGKTIWLPYWPGTSDVTTTTPVTAYILSHPNSLFLAQSNGAPITVADVGANVQFAIGTGSTIGGGFSGATLDASNIAVTSTFPFRIWGLWNSVGNGSDVTTNYNYAIVTFNNQDFKSLTGIA